MKKMSLTKGLAVSLCAASLFVACGDEGAKASDDTSISCKTEQSADSSGTIILCNGDSIGVVLNGKDGADGKDGKDGSDGKKGDQGSDGKDGADGKDGVSCTIAEKTEFFVAIACGDSVFTIDVKDSVSANPNAINDAKVTGFVQKGPFKMGSKVVAYEMSPTDLRQTGVFTTGYVLSDSGRYEIRRVSQDSEIALLEADGLFLNEKTGTQSDAPFVLRSLVDVANHQNANVNVLTHLEYDRVVYLVTEKGFSFVDAKKQAKKDVLRAFHAEDAIDDAVLSESNNLFGVEPSDSALVMLSVLLQGDRNENELKALLNSISYDIAEDSTWDDLVTRAKLADWALETDLYNSAYSSFALNLTKWGLGIPADFRKYIRNYWNQELNLGFCADENLNVVKNVTNPLSTMYAESYNSAAEVGGKTRFICDAGTGLWRVATDIEKDTMGFKHDYNEADVRNGAVNNSFVYVYEDGNWRRGVVADSTLGLHGCTAARADTVGQGVAKTDTSWYKCVNRQWRKATNIEKDTATWGHDYQDADVRNGNVNRTSVYVYEDGNWRSGYTLDSALGLRGCTAARVDTVGQGIAKTDTSWYKCVNRQWRKATDIEKDTATWGAGRQGEVRNGKVNKNLVYVYQGSAWRHGTELDSLMTSVGGSACMADGDTSLVKLDNLYYVCKNQSTRDTVRKWVVAPVIYNDTYENRKNCTAEKDGNLMEGRITPSNVYVCDYSDTDNDGASLWEPASDIEKIIGGCRNRTPIKDSVGMVNNRFYACVPEKWEEAKGNWELASLPRYNTPRYTCDGKGKIYAGLIDTSMRFTCVLDTFRVADSVDVWLDLGCIKEGDRVVSSKNQTEWICADNKWSWDTTIPVTGTLEDVRDGKIYSTASIGRQVWMAENLNYTDSEAYPSMKGSVWDGLSNCGAYYRWSAVMDTLNTGCGYNAKCSVNLPFQGICPEGWHVPSEIEMKEFVSYAKNGDLLKSVGFNSSYCGEYPNTYDQQLQLWSSTKYSSLAWNMDIRDTQIYFNYGNASYGFNVRCIRDEQ